jgi:hypothetical protein
MKPAVVLVLTAAALAAAPASALAGAPAGPALARAIPNARIAQGGDGQQPNQPPLNVASDRIALNAYATYLTAIDKGITTAQQNDTAFIATISSGCKSALQPLTQPNEQVDATAQETLTVLGREMGDDLAISFDQAAQLAFDRLSTTLTHLRWTRLSGAWAIVRRYVNTQTAVLQMLPSDLCQDALLAASDPQTIPPNTKTFVKAYNKASNAANLALTNLLDLMQTYETPAEKPTVTKIASLAAQITKVTKADLLQSGASLTQTLET